VSGKGNRVPTYAKIMNPKNLFELNPKLAVCFVSGNSEAFEQEDDAKAHANHFNVSVKKVLRGEFIPESKGDTEEGGVKAKLTKAELKLAAEAKAKEEAHAEAKVKEEADAEAKAKEEAEAGSEEPVTTEAGSEAAVA
jgi:hypothetical protein